MIQKVEIISKPGELYMLKEHFWMQDSYLEWKSYEKHSNLKRDLENGWKIKAIWEDRYRIVLVLEL